jgi:hypothetical protein
MKRSRVLIVIAAVVLAAVVVLLIGRSRQTREAALGPMLPTSMMPDLAARRFAGEMRAWLGTMPPRDLKILDETGHLVLSWKDLKKTDPKHAALIDRYVEVRRKGIAQAAAPEYRKRRVPLPDRLAKHHDPDTIEFIKGSPAGYYQVVIRSSEGIRASYVTISAPQ